MPMDRTAYYADASTPASIATITAAMADAEADEMATRSIHSFKWADDAARAAQTGMAEGDIGDQADNNVTWRYSGSAWLPSLGSRMGGKVIRANTSVSFPATTWTPITTSADWTTTGGKSPIGGLGAFNGTWVAPIAGYYRVEAQLVLLTTATAFLAVKKNDNTATNAGTVLVNSASGASTFTAASVSGLLKLAASDVLRLFIFPSVTSTWSTTADFSFFGIEYAEGL